MENKTLETKVGKVIPIKTANENAYLASMMDEVRQEGYTCVSGCRDCISCGGNDYRPKK
tara:strand:- start:3317 stop:3493 length:177 start_codon:yes stop_codon:yes gene_type:complete